MNIFDRTAIFCKERRDGEKGSRIKRIGWDFISFPDETLAPKSSGLFVSPVPLPEQINQADETYRTTLQVDDMGYYPSVEDFDAVVDIIYLNENELYAKFENVFGFYDSDPSLEFGYPVDSGI